MSTQNKANPCSKRGFVQTTISAEREKFSVMDSVVAAGSKISNPALLFNDVPKFVEYSPWLSKRFPLFKSKRTAAEQFVTTVPFVPRNSIESVAVS